MNKFLVTGLALVLGLAQAEAQSSNTSSSEAAKGGETGVKLESVKPADATPKTGEADADEVITNRKLRAETGAKKKYSFSSSLAYSGGSIKKPLDDLRPNITGALGTQEDVSLNGSIGAKYRVSNLQSITLGAGVGVDKPFHSSEKSFGDRSYIDDPSVTYQVLSKLGGLQSVTSVGLGWYTNDFSRDLGYMASISASQTLVSDFDGSKFSVGAYIPVSYTLFDKDDVRFQRRQSDYGGGIYPFMEYVINDTLNVRTISGVWVYQHVRENDDAFWTFRKNKIYQSVGLGISVTRDIYLYPNVQFMPEDIRSDRTNVALSTTINL